MTIQTATADDAKGILEIYAPVIEQTPISFETKVPEVSEMENRIEKTLKTHPYLVMKKGELVTAYAYGSLYRPREAYKSTVETSIYVHPKHQGKGIGLSLYNHLLERLSELGFHTAVAALYVPNTGSVRLHKKAGFKRIGRLEQVGYKFEKWHDVEWWQKPLSGV